METSFPTLKRGANKHCAYGASARTSHMQFSIKPPAPSVQGLKPDVYLLHLRQSGLKP